MRLAESLNPTPLPPSEIAGDLVDGRKVFYQAFAQGVMPPPQMSVSAWAEKYRYVSAESGSPHPGKWSNARTPYLVEPMDAMGLDDPCDEVTGCKSHQIGFTESAMNAVGKIIHMDPAPVLWVLPTLDEVSKFNRVKFTPMVSETKVLSDRVKDQKSRSGEGSTGAFKRFSGGYMMTTGANSSAGLQMVSARVRVGDEIAEFPTDAGERGDPLAQADKRLTAWDALGTKKINISTPGIKGLCRISKKFDASDQCRFYVPCPECGTFQVLEFKNLKWDKDEAPFGAFFVCVHGCCIQHHHKLSMIAQGVWIKTFDGGDENPPPPQAIEADKIEIWRARKGRGAHRGFHIWQAYSPFVSWDKIVAEHLDADGNPAKEKTFFQQVLGQAYEDVGEAPDHEKLFARREAYPLGRMPVGALVPTGFCDVQGDRLEWAVWSWGIGLTGWLIDKGIIEGNPETDDSVWQKLNAVISRTYEDYQGKQWPIEAFGIDAGYLSHRVYDFVRRQGPTVMAMKGKEGALRPMMGTPTKVDVNWRGRYVRGGCQLWITGVDPTKSDIYARLSKTIQGQDAYGNWPLGCLHLPDAVDESYIKQMTAEYRKEVDKNGQPDLRWVCPRDVRNEALDIVVGSRILAYHLGLDHYSTDRWKQLAEQRGAPPEQVQHSLAQLWSPGASLPDSERRSPEGDGKPVERQTVDRSANVVERGGGAVRVRGQT